MMANHKNDHLKSKEQELEEDSTYKIDVGGL